MATRRPSGIWYTKRRYPVLGKKEQSLGTRNRATAVTREQMLLMLPERGHVHVLRAFFDGDLEIHEVQEAYEAGQLHQLAARLRRGTATLGGAVRAALDQKAPDVKASTLERYRDGLAHFQRFVADDSTPVADALTDDLVQQFKGFRLKAGVAEQTVNNDLGAVSVLATYALKKGWIDERPEIRRFEYRARIRWLDAGQLASYMAALRPAFRVQMQLLVATGMRLGESEGLLVCDLKLGLNDGRAMIEDSKTSAGVRVVFVPVWVAEPLQRHIDEQDLSGTDCLFTIDRRTVQAEHKRACGLVGIHHHTIHDHRHTAAVHLARAGMPLHLLQQQLGHKHIEMTMKYARFHPDYSDVAGYFDAVGEKLGLGAKPPQAARPSPARGVQPSQATGVDLGVSAQGESW